MSRRDDLCNNESDYYHKTPQPIQNPPYFTQHEQAIRKLHVIEWVWSTCIKKHSVACGH